MITYHAVLHFTTFNVDESIPSTFGKFSYGSHDLSEMSHLIGSQKFPTCCTGGGFLARVHAMEESHASDQLTIHDTPNFGTGPVLTMSDVCRWLCPDGTVG